MNEHNWCNTCSIIWPGDYSYCPLCGDGFSRYSGVGNPGKRSGAKPKGASENFVSLKCWPEGFGVSVNEHEDQIVVALFYKSKRAGTLYIPKPLPARVVNGTQLSAEFNVLLRAHGVNVQD